MYGENYLAYLVHEVRIICTACYWETSFGIASLRFVVNAVVGIACVGRRKGADLGDAAHDDHWE
jgi:hypothetical protein